MTARARLLAPAKSRVTLGLGAAVVLVLVGLAIAVLVSILGGQGTTRALDAHPSASSTAGSPTSGARGALSAIFVHVVGAVEHPGLFSLHDGDRVIDAVAAAGGFTDAADRAQVNLARFVTDGEQLIVPVVGAAPPAAGGSAGLSGGRINLNTADLASLETLPRVGPAMAKRIIDWRTSHGRFASVEDLMSVTGVGDKTFEQLKDLVTV